MAEFRETFITEPEVPIAIAKLANTKFGLTLSPYDTPEQVLVAVLQHLGVAVSTAETFDTLLLKILDRVS